MGIPQSTRLCCLEKHTDSQLTFPSAHFSCHSYSFYQPTQFFPVLALPCHAALRMGWSEGKGWLVWNAALGTNVSSRSWEYLLLGCWHKAQLSWECPERAQTGDVKLDTLLCWVSPVSLLISELHPSPELSFKPCRALLSIPPCKALPPPLTSFQSVQGSLCSPDPLQRNKALYKLQTILSITFL